MKSLSLFSLVFALSIFAVHTVHASESTQLDTTLVENSVFDLNWEEKDRVAQVFAQFENFDPTDEYFTMSVIQVESGDTVADSRINVYTTAEGLVNFGSMVAYVVTDLDICAYEISEEESEPFCTNVMTGDYEIQIKTKDGSVVDSETITIIDSRVF